MENDAAAAEALAAEDESDDGDVDDNLDEAEAHIVDLVEVILREKGLQPMGNQATLKVVEVILNPESRAASAINLGQCPRSDTRTLHDQRGDCGGP